MPVTADKPRRAVPPSPPSLQNGDRLTSHEFLRRYEAMPDVKKAELIQGVVYLGTWVNAEHGAANSLIQLCLGSYAAFTPALHCLPNVTTILGPTNVVQPDACLCLPASAGGQTRLNEKKYLVGPPELIVEIAASTASIDLGDKLESYAMAGVREYLVWRTQDAAFDWFALADAEFLPVKPDARGLLRSRVFPGLTLDVKALLSGHGAKLLSTLQRGLASAAHKTFAASLRRNFSS